MQEQQSCGKVRPCDTLRKQWRRWIAAEVLGLEKGVYISMITFISYSSASVSPPNTHVQREQHRCHIDKWTPFLVCLISLQDNEWTKMIWFVSMYRLHDYEFTMNLRTSYCTTEWKTEVGHNMYLLLSQHYGFISSVWNFPHHFHLTCLCFLYIILLYLV